MEKDGGVGEMVPCRRCGQSDGREEEEKEREKNEGKERKKKNEGKKKEEKMEREKKEKRGEERCLLTREAWGKVWVCEDK